LYGGYIRHYFDNHRGLYMSVLATSSQMEWSLLGASDSTERHTPGVGQQMMETQDYSVLSVMGPHAGEESGAIFARKIADIREVGRTFWVIRSHKAKPDMIQTIGTSVCSGSGERLCAFLAPSSPGGAVPTKTSGAAIEYSADRSKWNTIPVGISPVTGQMTKGTCALYSTNSASVRLLLLICGGIRISSIGNCQSGFDKARQPFVWRVGTLPPILIG
jgi:hypothetical protein